MTFIWRWKLKPLVVALLGLSLFACASCGTGSTCGLGLVGRLSFPPPREAFPSVDPGESAYQNVTIPAYRSLEIDLINESTPTAPVDAFLTTSTCDKLFAGPYAGGTPPSLCTIYYGPVAHGVRGVRKKISPGIYRIFVQAYAGNTTAGVFTVDLGLWSDDCRIPMLGPS